MSVAILGHSIPLDVLGNIFVHADTPTRQSLMLLCKALNQFFAVDYFNHLTVMHSLAPGTPLDRIEYLSKARFRDYVRCVS
jgi:hypothetical protein